MKLHCPNCGVKGSADDSYLGRKVKCPKCQGIFVVVDDSSMERLEDAAFSAPTATPVPSSPVLQEEALPAREDEDLDESGPVAALSGVATEEMLDFADDVAESGPAMMPPAQQSAIDDDSFNLDDIAAEIEMQMAAAEAAGEPEGIPDGSPVDIGSLEDEFDQPTAGETVAPEIAAIADNYIAEIEEDAVQLVEEQEAVEPEVKEVVEPPLVQSGENADQKQCGQCGKNEGSDESFITNGGELYCSDCAPVAEPVKSADANTEQEVKTPEAPADAGSEDDSQSSFGAALKKIWTKIKAALFS